MTVHFSGNPAVVTGGAFVVGDDGSLYEITQSPPGEGWSAWINRSSPADVTLLPSPAVSLNNFIDLTAWNPVVIGNANRRGGQIGGRLYSLPQTDGGNSWSGNESPDLSASPAVIALVGNGIQFTCAIGADGTLQSIGLSGPDGWHALPGVSLRSSPCVGLNQAGLIELFAVEANDAALWHIWQTGTNNSTNSAWSNWATHKTPPGVLLESSPAIAQNANQCLELFIVGTDGSLWQIVQTKINNGWSGWLSRGTPPGGIQFRNSPAVAANSKRLLELFAVGTDGALWHIWQTGQTAINGGWSGWYSHGTPPGIQLGWSPAVAINGVGRLETFAVGTDGALWHIWQTQPSGGWSGWYSHGTP